MIYEPLSVCRLAPAVKGNKAHDAAKYNVSMIFNLYCGLQ